MGEEFILTSDGQIVAKQDRNELIGRFRFVDREDAFKKFEGMNDWWFGSICINQSIVGII